MIIAILVFGSLTVLLLWFILSKLADINAHLKEIYWKNFNIECENPFDHFKFTKGADSE